MTSATQTISTVSPPQAASTLGLQSPRRTAWTDIFADYAVRHMAANGVLNLKAALELLIEEDSNKPERDRRG